MLRLISLNGVASVLIVFGFEINVSLSFCSDFSLIATVVKTDEIRDLKQLFTPCFPLI